MPTIHHAVRKTDSPFLTRSALIRCCCLALVTMAAVAGPIDNDWQTPPGWTRTHGGSDGRVIRVTTLATKGKGSLAEALSRKDPRVIVFMVGGIIDLSGHVMDIKHPCVTIAGETAPSPGITLTNGGIDVSTHDVIVRHLHIRPGAGKRAKKSGWEVDGLSTIEGAHDVIVDHCSLTWATDENLSASGPRFEGATPDEWRKNTSHRITFSHCLIAEGLFDSTHAKGPHSKGSLIHDNVTDIAIIGNLYLSNDDRNPLFKGGTRGAVVNNLIVNPGQRVMQSSLVADEWKGHEWQRGAMVIVGNVAREGASTKSKTIFLGGVGPCDVFLKDNLFFDANGAKLPTIPVFHNATGSTSADQRPRLAEKRMFWPPGLKAKPATETAEWVLASVGACPWDRDAIDRRLVKEARTGGGKIINFESEVGGLPRPGKR